MPVATKVLAVGAPVVLAAGIATAAVGVGSGRELSFTAAAGITPTTDKGLQQRFTTGLKAPAGLSGFKAAVFDRSDGTHVILLVGKAGSASAAAKARDSFAGGLALGNAARFTTEPAGSKGGTVECKTIGGEALCVFSDDALAGALIYPSPSVSDAATLLATFRAANET